MDVDQINEAFGLSSTGKPKTPLLSDSQRKEILKDSSAISWFGNPKIQGIIIGVVVLFLFGAAYKFFTPTQQVAQQPLPSNQFDPRDQIIEEQRQTQNESDARNAFGTQKAYGMQVVPAGKKVTPPRVVRSPRIAQRVVPPTPPRVVYRQVPVRQSTPIVAPPPPPPPSVPVSMPVQAKPIEEPNAAIARLNNLGVVVDGSGGNSAQPVVIASSDTGTLQDAVYVPEQDPATLGQTDYPTGTVLPEEASQSPMDSVSQSQLHPQEASMQTSIPATGAFQVRKGEKAKAKIDEPIEWNAETDISSQTFQATLSEDFGSIPKDAVVTLQPDPNQKSRNSGVLQLIPTSIRVAGSEYPVPEGIKVVSNKGGLLRAKIIRPTNGFGVTDAINIAAGVASAGLGGIVDNDDMLTSMAVNAGGNLLNRTSYSLTQRQISQSDPPIFRFSGSIRLVASEDVQM